MIEKQEDNGIQSCISASPGMDVSSHDTCGRQSSADAVENRKLNVLNYDQVSDDKVTCRKIQCLCIALNSELSRQGSEQQ